MSENISPEQYRAELTYMNHEIAALKDELEKKKHIDKFDAFGNVTEFRDYREPSGDYSKILPQIEEPGFEIPLVPGHMERKALRKNFNVAGICVILSDLVSMGLYTAITFIIIGAIMLVNPNTDRSAIARYMNETSLTYVANALSFMTCNIGFAFLGLKICKVRSKELVRTTDFSFSKGFQYAFIALFLQTVAAYASFLITQIMENCGYTVYSHDYEDFSMPFTGKIVAILYGCLIAPVTEELFYRGMLLKLFSKANQRFAIFFSALLFGLGHGNLPQFLLAFLVGIFLGHITMKHNSIIPAIICHIVVNSKSDLMSILETSLGKNTGNMTTLVIDTVATFFGAVMLFDFRLKNKLPATTPHQTRRGISIAFTSVPIVIAVGFELATMIYMILSVS